MALRCPACGAESAADSRFCAQCGTALGASPPRGARKVVTALFADTVGSTALAERLDPEDFTEIVGAGVRRMAECVERFGGSVSELAGDGLLGLFGAPVAHEDDPERAVLAGLAIIAASTEYAAEVATEHAVQGYAVRVGIETGLAVLGQLGGGGRMEYGAMGDSLNTAARLEAAADVGGVLVGPETYRLIHSRFDCGEARELELKGKAERVLAYPVFAALEDPRQMRGLEGAEARLVGREAELETARTTLADLRAGRGGVLIVTGEAGLGKTRLVAELRRLFAEELGARTIEGRCVSYGEAMPYWPINGLLRDWLGRRSDAALRGYLRSECRRLLGDGAEEAAKSLAILLGLEAVEESPDPELLQQRLHEACAALLRALAGERPLVVALDDLHWADPSSLALLTRVLSICAEAPVVLVLAARPDPAAPLSGLRAAVRPQLGAGWREVELHGLPPQSEQELLGELIGVGTLPDHLERRVLERAEGNPFYLEETVRSLVEAGALSRSGAEWRFDREVDVQIPDTVEQVVLARIDRLPRPSQELLAAAAVLGRQFERGLLERVASEVADSNAALAELRRADLLREIADTPEPTYRFKHQLIREAAYRSLLKRRRQELHGRAADGMEQLHPDLIDEQAGLLALHCSAAGDDERGLRYHQRAGDAARRINSPTEAVEHHGAALAAAGRLGLAAADPTVRKLHEALGQLSYDLGDAEAAIRHTQALLAGAAEAGDLAHELEARLRLGGFVRATDFARGADHNEEAVRLAETRGGPVELVDALTRSSIYLANGLRLRRARELAARALAVAERDAGERERLRGFDALKLVAQQTGDLDELERLTSTLVASLGEEATEAGWDRWVAEQIRMWSLVESATVSIARGRFDEARGRADAALALVEKRGSLGHEPVFREAFCRLGRASGDYTSALEQGRRATAIAEGSEMTEWGAWAAATLGWTLLDLRAADEAIALLEPWARRAESAGITAQHLRCVSLLAWAAALSGNLAAAADHRTRAQELLAQVNARPGEAWLFGAHAYFAVARVLLEEGYHDRAESMVAPVLAAAERAQWLENVAYGSLVVGLARLAGGRPDGAEGHLARALEVASSRGFAGAEWEANAALATLRAQQGRGDEADDHAAAARRIVERLAADLGEDPLARTFPLRAFARITPGTPGIPAGCG